MRIGSGNNGNVYAPPAEGEPPLDLFPRMPCHAQAFAASLNDSSKMLRFPLTASLNITERDIDTSRQASTVAIDSTPPQQQRKSPVTSQA